MDKQKELELVNKYPNLYKDYGGDMRKTCMAWGLAVGDGWYNIIDELSEKLEALGCVAVQVKEKFGGLRFYLGNYPEGAHELITEAEEKSYKTCERCGKPGSPKGGGWVKTLCDECRNSE